MEIPQLLKWLEEGCPDKAPREQITEFQIGVLVGKQEILDKIRAKILIEEKITKDK